MHRNVLALVLVLIATASSRGLPVGVSLLTMPSGQQYIYLTNMTISYNEARTICEVLGGKLADIYQNCDYMSLASGVESIAWINSWDGDGYSGTPLAFYPGGAIAVAAEPVLQAALCDVLI